MIGTLVTTRHGRLRGIAGDGTVTWRGIPYAAPPVGALRWAAPQAIEPWSGVRDAGTYGPAPVQPVAPGSEIGVVESYAEDCLYLNVCAPARGVGHPVLVSIPGGGFRNGHGAMSGDGERFAEDGIVVVTLNYRLGALGLAALPGAPESGVGSLLDQIAALRWVRDNVEVFGGDPARVTVYGVSAGGKSVGNLMASPPARGLFARAISSSGGADHVADPDTGAAVATRLCAELGSDDVDELRRMPAEDVVAAQERILTGIAGTWLWRPTRHPTVLPTLPRDGVAAGSSIGVPLLAGANGNEAATYAALAGLANVVAPADSVLTGILGEPAATNLLTTYQRSRGLDRDGARLAAMGDERYGIPTLRLLDAQAGHAPTYRYRVDVAAPGIPPSLDGGHGTETSMVWATRALAFGATSSTPDPAREATAGMVHNAWRTFVTTGVPSVEGVPWPAYEVDSRPTMIFDEAPHVENDPRAEERLAWGTRSWTSGTWYPVPDASSDR